MWKILKVLLLVPACTSRRSCTIQDVVEDVATTVVAEAASLLHDRESKSQVSYRCKARDCQDLLQHGEKESGVYSVWPQGWQGCEGIKVFCDMTSQGGGWTVIQRRGDFGKPKDFFYKSWRYYKFGFGNLKEDFWLGNDNIYHLTNQNLYEIRIDLTTKEGETRFANYEEFHIENEDKKYALNIQGYNGDAGDSLSSHQGLPFTTKDRDNDPHETNCATIYKGAWWYTKCHQSNLNGLYLNGYHETFADGAVWLHWKGYNYSYKETEMKIRPKITKDLS